MMISTMVQKGHSALPVLELAKVPLPRFLHTKVPLPTFLHTKVPLLTFLHTKVPLLQLTLPVPVCLDYFIWSVNLFF